MPNNRVTDHLRLAIVILAAGASRRMGRSKLLLPWGETSVLGHLLSVWKGLQAAQLTVVCAGGDRLIEKELNRLKFPAEDRITNPDPERGMFSSIQCAAAWKGWQSGLTHWAIVLGDQPHLRPETLRALLNFTAAHRQKICQPSRAGRPRHPVILPGNFFGRLRETAVENLKEFIEKEKDNLARCEVEDAGLDVDLDTPAEYNAALEGFHKLRLE